MGIYKVKGKKEERWYIDVRIGGRRVRRVAGTEEEALQVETTIKADALRGEYRWKRGLKVKFSDFIKDYLVYKKKNLRSRLAYDRIESAMKHLKKFFGDFLLSEITVADIEDYKSERLKTVSKRTRRMISPSTVNRETVTLSNIFRIASKLGKFDGTNPMAEVERLGEQKKPPRVLSADEIRWLLDAANDRLRPILIVALNTGMRKREILDLLWEDVDFISHFILIRKSKTNVIRRVPMSSLVSETLKALPRTNSLVFPNPVTENAYEDIFYMFKGVLKKAGISLDVRFHDLRHTAASLMVASGVDLVTVGEILGHADIKTTMIYAHPSSESKRMAVERLGTIIKGDKKPSGKKKLQDDMDRNMPQVKSAVPVNDSYSKT